MNCFTYCVFFKFYKNFELFLALKSNALGITSNIFKWTVNRKLLSVWYFFKVFFLFNHMNFLQCLIEKKSFYNIIIILLKNCWSHLPVEQFFLAWVYFRSKKRKNITKLIIKKIIYHIIVTLLRNCWSHLHVEQFFLAWGYFRSKKKKGKYYKMNNYFVIHL